MIEDADRAVGLIARSGVAESNVPTAVQFRRAEELLIVDLIHADPKVAHGDRGSRPALVTGVEGRVGVWRSRAR